MGSLTVQSIGHPTACKNRRVHDDSRHAWMGSGVTCGGSAYALYGLGVGPPSRAAQAMPRAGDAEAAEDDVVRPRKHASARAALACASGLQSTTERDLGRRIGRRRAVAEGRG